MFSISGFILFAKEFIYGLSTVSAKLSSLYIICYLGLVKFSVDKYFIAIYLSLGKYGVLLFTLLFSRPWGVIWNYFFATFQEEFPLTKDGESVRVTPGLTLSH